MLAPVRHCDPPRRLNALVGHEVPDNASYMQLLSPFHNKKISGWRFPTPSTFSSSRISGFLARGAENECSFGRLYLLKETNAFQCSEVSSGQLLIPEFSSVPKPILEQAILLSVNKLESSRKHNLTRTASARTVSLIVRASLANQLLRAKAFCAKKNWFKTERTVCLKR